MVTIIPRAVEEELAQGIIAELGVQNSSKEIQEGIVLLLGENIVKRVTLELAKVVPQDQHDKLQDFIGSGDFDGLRTFLSEHVPELDEFIRHHALTEYELTKTRAQALLQGIDEAEL